RVHFAWVSAAEGKKWAQLVNEVTTRIRQLGPRPSAWGQPVPGVTPPPAPKPSITPLQPASDAFARQTAELRQTARQWLEEGTVKVVVGYGEGSLPGMVRPVFITDPGEVDQLVWNSRCRQNLSVYLTRPWVTEMGPVGLVVKGCDERSIVGLTQENHPGVKDVHLIGMVCGGVADESGALAARCVGCSSRTPSFAERVIGEAAPSEPGSDPRLEEIARLEAMGHAERWNFWQAHFARCLRCYACRAACPLCSCERCIADKTQPRWIPSGATGAGNLSWNLARAQHLAGRCIDCNACTDACPAGIPLYLLNRKLAKVVEERFGYVAGRDPQAPPALTTFREDDPQEFIH
ncbi:MAG: 4Fe-4S dicluster domain-containing protein, partial [Armatimonadota bacterium]|nr:4Fe-4S dicluster domain-containing protein [Armatimonadota bacterium]